MQERQVTIGEETYKLVLRNSPNDAQALFFLGTIYEEESKRQEAIAKFKQAIKAYRRAELDPALHAIARAAYLKPGNPMVRLYAARILEAMGEPERAAQHYQRYQQQSTRTVFPHAGLEMNVYNRSPYLRYSVKPYRQPPLVYDRAERPVQ